MTSYSQQKLVAIKEMIPYLVKGISPTSFIPVVAKLEQVTVTERTLWNYYSTRDEWMPLFAEIRDMNVDGMVASRLLEAKEARKLLWVSYQNADSSWAEVGAASKIIDSSYKEIEILQSLGLLPLKPVEVTETKSFKITTENQFKKNGKFELPEHTVIQPDIEIEETELPKIEEEEPKDDAEDNQ